MPEIARYPEKLDLIETLNIRINERTLSKCTIPLHWHEYFELELFLSGSGKSVINHQSYPCESGTLFLLSPLDSHSYTIASEQADMLNVAFNMQCLEDIYLPEFLTMKSYTAIKLSEQDILWMSTIIRKMNAESQGSKFLNKKYISKLLACLLIEVIRLHKENTVDKNITLPESIQNAMQYMHLHFRETINLHDIADSAGLSSNHLSEKFHQYVGVTYKTYLIKLRLDYAVRLIEITETSISELSFFCGFNSSAYFHRVFKSKFGISPYQYRKNSRNKQKTDG